MFLSVSSGQRVRMNEGDEKPLQRKPAIPSVSVLLVIKRNCLELGKTRNFERNAIELEPNNRGRLVE